MVAVGALFDRLLGAREVISAVDQRQMRKRLRKIADQALGALIVFFTQQTDVVPQGNEIAEKPLRVGNAALQNVGINEPKAAGEKRAFFWREPVVCLFRVITHDKTVAQQAALDCRDSNFHPRIGDGQKADRGKL
jgi:hypothetical protein